MAADNAAEGADTPQRGEEAQALCERTLAGLRAYGLAPTPRLYTLFYNYYANRDPDLVAALDAAAQAGNLNDARCKELYGQFFGLAQEEKALREARQELNKLMQQLMSSLSQAGDDTQRYTDSLQTAQQGLKKDFVDPQDLRALITMIAQETRQLTERNQTLERELQNSAQRVEHLQDSLEEARRASSRDGLTGLANRKAFDMALEQFADAAHHADSDPAEGKLALLLLDIDNFKQFNDRYGHPIGDEVLKLCGQVITRDLDDTDLAARYGGEEFAVILTGRDKDAVLALAERLRDRMSRKRIRQRATNRDFGQVTLSVGAAYYRAGESPDALVRRADDALYAAKRQGRDRVCSEDVAEPVE